MVQTKNGPLKPSSYRLGPKFQSKNSNSYLGCEVHGKFNKEFPTEKNITIRIKKSTQVNKKRKKIHLGLFKK